MLFKRMPFGPFSKKCMYILQDCLRHAHTRLKISPRAMDNFLSLSNEMYVYAFSFITLLMSSCDADALLIDEF